MAPLLHRAAIISTTSCIFFVDKSAAFKQGGGIDFTRPWALGEGTYVASLYQLCSLGSAVGTSSRIWGAPETKRVGSILTAMNGFWWYLNLVATGVTLIPVIKSWFIVVCERGVQIDRRQ